MHKMGIVIVLTELLTLCRRAAAAQSNSKQQQQQQRNCEITHVIIDTTIGIMMHHALVRSAV
jgi:hypothetical protein